MSDWEREEALYGDIARRLLEGVGANHPTDYDIERVVEALADADRAGYERGLRAAEGFAQRRSRWWRMGSLVGTTEKVEASASEADAIATRIREWLAEALRDRSRRG